MNRASITTSIADRFKTERNRLGLSQTKMGEILGVGKTTIINWEKGLGTPDTGQLSKLATFGGDTHYIVTGYPHGVREDVRPPLDPDRSPPWQGQAAELPTKATAINAAARDAYVYVPRYDVQASAGNGSVVHDEAIVDHLAFKREWVVGAMGLDPRHLALIDVVGDSMVPTIGDGDLLLIDTRPAGVRSDGVYVINLGGALLVKRLRLRMSGEVDVVSDNDRYGTETIGGDQLEQLQVLGRGVWQGRRI